MLKTEITMWTETARAIIKMLRIAGYKVHTSKSLQKRINIKVFNKLDTQDSNIPIAFYSVDLIDTVAHKNKYGDFQLIDIYAWAEGLIKNKENEVK